MKTKEQKKKEATARNRMGFFQKRLNWLECQPGGERYDRMLKHYGKDEAEKLQESANICFKKAQVAAHVDSHGNPLEKL
jgi:hypothetical protein